MKPTEAQINVTKYLRCLKIIDRIKDDWIAWDQHYRYAVAYGLISIYKSITDEALQVGLTRAMYTIDNVVEDWIWYQEAAWQEVYNVEKPEIDPTTGY